MGKKKEELVGNVSRFLRDSPSALFAKDSRPVESRADTASWAEGMQKAAEKYYRPQRQQREINQLRTEVCKLTKRVRGKNASKKREAPLKAFIRTVKTEHPDYTQQQIMEAVDRRLGVAKKNFAQVAPRGWQGLTPPIRFADILLRPKNDRLRKLAKPYISKV
jgi:hypothetical protein